MPEVDLVRTIGHKSPVAYIPRIQVHRRQSIASGEPHDLRRVNHRERIAEDVDRFGTLRVRCLEGRLELIRLARLDDDQLHSEKSSNLGELR